MGFKIEREEYVNKTFRIEKKLVEEMEKICDKKNISLNKLVVMCINYALNDLEEDDQLIQLSSFVLIIQLRSIFNIAGQILNMQMPIAFYLKSIKNICLSSVFSVRKTVNYINKKTLT